MPKRKIVEAPVVTAAEPKKSRVASKPRAAVVKHKRATKNTVEVPNVALESIVDTAPLATAAAPVMIRETVLPRATKVLVTREQIARVAYSYWEARGYRGGSPEGDWLRAEQELAQLA